MSNTSCFNAMLFTALYPINKNKTQGNLLCKMTSTTLFYYVVTPFTARVKLKEFSSNIAYIRVTKFI